eukprot:405849-Rhodomonas_salina.2
MARDGAVLQVSLSMSGAQQAWLLGIVRDLRRFNLLPAKLTMLAPFNAKDTVSSAAFGTVELLLPWSS